MKDALTENDVLVEAALDAPQVATCPACGATVDLRSRRTGDPGDRTWYYRHRRGEGQDCPRRSSPGW